MLNSMDGGADGAQIVQLGCFGYNFYGSLFKFDFNPFFEKSNRKQTGSEHDCRIIRQKNTLDVSDMLTSYIEPAKIF